MPGEFEPWIKYPALTAERLSVVANLIRETRRTTVLLHDPIGGDNEWSLGCRAYARTCFALQQATERYSWLTVLPEQESLRFTFAIGLIPVKFYHGEADGAPSHYCTITGTEMGQQQLAFQIDGVELAGQVLRIAVVTDVSRRVSKVVLVELDSETGAAAATYEIPFDLKSDNVVQLQSRPVDLPRPELEPLPTAEELKVAESELKRKKRDAN